MNNEVKILNMSQVYFYIENNVNPKRVECGYKHKLVFVFDKDATNELFTKWLNNPSRPNSITDE